MDKDLLTVSNSILAGSILIALSIFLSGYSSGALNADKNTAVLPDPEEKVEVASRSDAPKEGRGKVVVIEFSDFQCPFCQKFYNETYNQIKKDYIDTGKITFIFRHFPIASLHQNAEKAAQAAECASKQGKFFEYHDELFSTFKPDGSNLEAGDLKSFAEDLKLDMTKFNNCLDKGESVNMVNTDMEAGQLVGVSGTPTFFVDGKRIIGAQPYSVFKEAIEQALKN